MKIHQVILNLQEEMEAHEKPFTFHYKMKQTKNVAA
jgi:hypothetical protein